jgi:hypothetical protein
VWQACVAIVDSHVALSGAYRKLYKELTSLCKSYGAQVDCSNVLAFYDPKRATNGAVLDENGSYHSSHTTQYRMKHIDAKKNLRYHQDILNRENESLLELKTLYDGLNTSVKELHNSKRAYHESALKKVSQSIYVAERMLQYSIPDTYNNKPKPR